MEQPDPAPEITVHEGPHRELQVRLPSGTARVVDDDISQRLRCDHPHGVDGEALAGVLKEECLHRGRSRAMVLAPPATASGLRRGGFDVESTIPGLYADGEDCSVMGWSAESERAEPNPFSDRVLEVVLAQPAVVPDSDLPEGWQCRPAVEGDAAQVTDLLAHVFDRYPTPIDSPAHLLGELAEGVPFQVVTDAGGRVMGSVAASPHEDGAAAELTHFAVHPDANPLTLLPILFQCVLDDLRARGCGTAFAFARAVAPEVNLAFRQLGFRFGGRCPRSCRIGTGLEDMNTWSRTLR